MAAEQENKYPTLKWNAFNVENLRVGFGDIKKTDYQHRGAIEYNYADEDEEPNWKPLRMQTPQLRAYRGVYKTKYNSLVCSLTADGVFVDKTRNDATLCEDKKIHGENADVVALLKALDAVDNAVIDYITENKTKFGVNKKQKLERMVVQTKYVDNVKIPNDTEKYTPFISCGIQEYQGKIKTRIWDLKKNEVAIKDIPGPINMMVTANIKLDSFWFSQNGCGSKAVLNSMIILKDGTPAHDFKPEPKFDYLGDFMTQEQLEEFKNKDSNPLKQDQIKTDIVGEDEVDVNAIQDNEQSSFAVSEPVIKKQKVTA